MVVELHGGGGGGSICSSVWVSWLLVVAEGCRRWLEIGMQVESSVWCGGVVSEEVSLPRDIGVYISFRPEACRRRSVLRDQAMIAFFQAMTQKSPCQSVPVSQKERLTAPWWAK